MNAISLSLWGDDPKYCMGSIRNAEIAKLIYPGWVVVVYADLTVPEDVTLKLVKLGVELRKPPCSNGMFWRYFTAFGGFEHVIFRDTDSRLNERESLAVVEWIESGRLAHIIADHPHHTPLIGGGMWGIKPTLASMLKLIDCPMAKLENDRNKSYNSDQIWLRDSIWPLIKNDVLIHDLCYHSRRPGAKPFPSKFGDNRFVGEVFDANDKPRSFDWEMRMNYQEA